MKYRKFGKLDWEVSVLGFGAMRLPTIDNDPAQIDEEEATRIMRYGIDHGINYVDTAYPYHGGQGEPVVGRILQDGYRERVKVATKLPCWLVKNVSDFDRLLDEQLERLQTDHIDFYLLHSLRDPTWPLMKRLNVFDWADKALADGRISHLGFSFHDQYEMFEEIVDAYDNWAMCQIQYNYMDVEYQAGTRGLKYAADKGIAVVAMEPIRGGRIAQNVPPAIQSLWDSATHKRTPADWALQWLWSQPEVTLVLSGMSALEHVEENLASADRSQVGLLTDEELALIAQVAREVSGAEPDSMYRLPVLHAVPERREHPTHLRALQRRAQVQRLADSENVVRNTAGGESCQSVRRMWPVHGGLSAAHRNPRMVGEGGRTVRTIGRIPFCTES